MNLFQNKKERWGLGTHGPALDLAPTKQLASKISIKVVRGLKGQRQVAKEAFLKGGDNFRALIVVECSGAQLTVDKDFKFGETNKITDFLRVFPIDKASVS